MRYKILGWPECQSAILDPKAIELVDGRCAMPDDNGEFEKVAWPESQSAIERGAPVATDGQTAFVRKVCVVIHYMYRDAGNWKNHGSVAACGELPDGIESPEDYYRALKEAMDGDTFVATQVGFPVLFSWEGYPGGDDHCWHELTDVEFVRDARYYDDLGISPTELLELFRKEAGEGWNPDLEIDERPCFLDELFLLEEFDPWMSDVGRKPIGIFSSAEAAERAVRERVEKYYECDPEEIFAIGERQWGHSGAGHTWSVSSWNLDEVAA